MTVRVAVRNGSVYLPAAVVDAYFRGIAAVIILIRETDLLVLPVRQAAAGGCLLKIRNAAGDRVASAPDVFAANWLDNWTGSDLPAQWSSDQCALVIPLIPVRAACDSRGGCRDAASRDSCVNGPPGPGVRRG